MFVAFIEEGSYDSSIFFIGFSFMGLQISKYIEKDYKDYIKKVNISINDIYIYI